MGLPYQGRHRRCFHPGCNVSISLKEQPRRFALGLCRAHEFDHPRDRIADRPDVRSAVVMGDASNSTGALAVKRVSLKREPDFRDIGQIVEAENALQPTAEKAKMNGPEGCLQHPPGPDHSEPVREVLDHG